MGQVELSQEDLDFCEWLQSVRGTAGLTSWCTTLHIPKLTPHSLCTLARLPCVQVLQFDEQRCQVLCNELNAAGMTLTD